MRLKDRVAIVTGAARGLGQAYCLALAREGATIVAADILMTEAAQGITAPETVARIRAWGLDQQISKRHEEPADLAGTVVFLASADSDFITGQTINVNGGATHH